VVAVMVETVAAEVEAMATATRYPARCVARRAMAPFSAIKGLMPTIMVKTSMLMQPYNMDTEWYTDTGATDHITSELDKLTTREKYGGADQVHAANGSGMPIRHIGQSSIRTHELNLILRNILHVPAASKNLVSVHKFTHDNNVFF
jgi:hypothetical protein